MVVLIDEEFWSIKSIDQYIKPFRCERLHDIFYGDYKRCLHDIFYGDYKRCLL